MYAIKHIISTNSNQNKFITNTNVQVHYLHAYILKNGSKIIKVVAIVGSRNNQRY